MASTTCWRDRSCGGAGTGRIASVRRDVVRRRVLSIAETSGATTGRIAVSVMNMAQAINDGLKTEMRRNQDVIVLGEDVARLGGVFRVTDGLLEEFGVDRVLDTPLSESGII